eukprot:scaffold3666_cov160-Amphora_coffeaeformis.AAC.4
MLAANTILDLTRFVGNSSSWSFAASSGSIPSRLSIRKRLCSSAQHSCRKSERPNMGRNGVLTVRAWGSVRKKRQIIGWSGIQPRASHVTRTSRQTIEKAKASTSQARVSHCSSSVVGIK